MFKLDRCIARNIFLFLFLCVVITGFVFAQTNNSNFTNPGTPSNGAGVGTPSENNFTPGDNLNNTPPDENNGGGGGSGGGGTTGKKTVQGGIATNKTPSPSGGTSAVDTNGDGKISIQEEIQSLPYATLVTLISIQEEIQSLPYATLVTLSIIAFVAFILLVVLIIFYLRRHLKSAKV